MLGGSKCVPRRTQLRSGTTLRHRCQEWVSLGKLRRRYLRDGAFRGNVPNETWEEGKLYFRKLPNEDVWKGLESQCTSRWTIRTRLLICWFNLELVPPLPSQIRHSLLFLGLVRIGNFAGVETPGARNRKISGTPNPPVPCAHANQKPPGLRARPPPPPWMHFRPTKAQPTMPGRNNRAPRARTRSLVNPPKGA